MQESCTRNSLRGQICQMQKDGEGENITQLYFRILSQKKAISRRSQVCIHMCVLHIASLA